MKNNEGEQWKESDRLSVENLIQSIFFVKLSKLKNFPTIHQI